MWLILAGIAGIAGIMVALVLWRWLVRIAGLTEPNERRRRDRHD